MGTTIPDRANFTPAMDKLPNAVLVKRSAVLSGGVSAVASDGVSAVASGGLSAVASVGLSAVASGGSSAALTSRWGLAAETRRMSNVGSPCPLKWAASDLNVGRVRRVGLVASGITLLVEDGSPDLEYVADMLLNVGRGNPLRRFGCGPAVVNC